MRYGTPLVSGALVYGDTDLGVTGAVIRATTATGTNGPGILYPCWDSSSDDTKRFRFRLDTSPSAGNLFIYENGAVDFEAPDGSYTAVGRLFADGVDQGSMTVSFLVGATSALSGDLLLDSLQISSSFSSSAPAGLAGDVVLDSFAITSGFSSVGTISGGLLLDSFAFTSGFSSVALTTVIGNLLLDDITLSSGFSSVQPSVLAGELTLGSFSVTSAFYSAGAGGLDSTTPLGKVRLKIGDYSDLPILPDAVIYSALTDCGNNINRTSQLCAQYILGALTSKTHKRLTQLETWSGEQFTNYVKFLQMTVLNPHLTTVAPVPYSGNGTEDHSIQNFVQDWKDGYLPGSVVIPPQTSGRDIEYAFT